MTRLSQFKTQPNSYDTVLLKINRVQLRNQDKIAQECSRIYLVYAWQAIEHLRCNSFIYVSKHGYFLLVNIYNSS